MPVPPQAGMPVPPKRRLALEESLLTPKGNASAEADPTKQLYGSGSARPHYPNRIAPKARLRTDCARGDTPMVARVRVGLAGEHRICAAGVGLVLYRAGF